MWLKQLTKTNFGHQIEQIKKVPLISWRFFHQSGEAKIKCFRELLQVLRWLERTLALNKVKNNPSSSSYSIGSQLRFIYIYVPLINSFWIHRECSDRLLGFVYLHGDDSFLNCPTRLKKYNNSLTLYFAKAHCLIATISIKEQRVWERRNKNWTKQQQTNVVHLLKFQPVKWKAKKILKLKLKTKFF